MRRLVSLCTAKGVDAVQAVLTIEALPQSPIEAAAYFHSQYLPRVDEELARDVAALAIILPAAPRDHDDWRRAVARDLARANAPKRVNVIAGADQAAIDGMLAYLRDAPGITGQYLPAHD